jgi:sterol desaturase/sphingolipid hydroxylase (fatty acid hydroxylase superfamily)
MGKNYISNKDETVRMFKSDFLESLSKVHFTVPLFLYIPVISYFLYRANARFDLSFYNQLFLILFGIFVWTFTEYTLHRFIFHFIPKSKFGQRIHFIFHGVHHDYPKDSKRLVMPPSVSLPLSVLFYFLFFHMIGNSYVSPFFAGFLTGYLFYDMTHYAIHHFQIHNNFFLYIKKHHMKHHYKDVSKGFGVSQPMWDYVYGTTFEQEEYNEPGNYVKNES